MVKIDEKRYYLLIVFLMTVIIYTYLIRYIPPCHSKIPPLHEIPSIIDDYTGSDIYQSPALLEVLDADTTLFRSYQNGNDRTIWLFIGFFGVQQERSQIHSPKNCYPGSGWDIVSDSSISIQTGEGEIEPEYLTITDGNEKRLVIYWFDTQSGAITNEFALKWFQMESSLKRKSQSATFVRFSTRIHGDEKTEETRDELVEFIETIIQDIEDVLDLKDREKQSVTRSICSRKFELSSIEEQE